jgi:tetratricopeptide (TPR) repeat protein
LEKAGDAPKAILMAKQAAKMKPELHLELARLYSRLDYQQELKSAAATAEDVFMKRLNSPSETESDRIAVAEARRLSDRLQQAADILNEGLLNKGSGANTKRALSEIQRLIYAKSIVQTEAGLYDGDITLLEKAADTDPSNPNISTEIAKLLPMKIANRLSPKMLPAKKLVDTLKEQMRTGIASCPAHIILAEVHFAEGNITAAIKDWEVALSKEPNNVGVMNNLSLILAKTSATNIDRSLLLLDKALSLSQNNAELLDTLGDVLMIAQRPKEAINKYELAVLSDRRRIGTRRKLVDVYRANGMEEMAKTMEAKIEELEREIETEKAKAEEEAKAQEKPKEN